MTTEQTLTDINPLINDLIAAGCPPLPEWCILTPHAYRIYGPVWKHDCDGSVENPDAVLDAVTAWAIGIVRPWVLEQGHGYPAYLLDPDGEGFITGMLMPDGEERHTNTTKDPASAILALLRAIRGVVCGEVK